MRKDFGVQTWLYPQPVIIIGTYDENGVPNAMNAAWGGICDYDKIIVDLAEHKTTDNIAKTNAFTIAFADSAHAVACDYVGMVSGRDVPDKFARAGFTAEKSRFVNAPVISELPVSIECELLKIEEDGRYIGRIVNVSADEKYLGADGLPDTGTFRPVLFDPIHQCYMETGREIGPAFKMGEELM